ncbi:MAG: translation elongation factor 4 [Candidatus Eisenbacteria bacterium]|nr:translation elongation factor 4 [Candidatus Eisenbacteria bacterium]
MTGTSDNTRNFCIIAHIDHGKSTLADRFLEITGTISREKMREQVLDDMDLERERGITIKSHPVTMHYSLAGEKYVINLIDTPGHVDFSYEVSRSLAACEGALLLVDAAQGVQAQTVSNLNMAREVGLTIIPVVNKIDLSSARTDDARKQLCSLLGEDVQISYCSARTGQGVLEVLDRVVREIPPPSGSDKNPLRALAFDSEFDQFKGVITYVRVMEGTLGVGRRIRFLFSEKEFEVTELGTFRPAMVACSILRAGNVGYVMAGIKRVADAKVGDTVADADCEDVTPLPGYRQVKPMVFCGIHPVEGEEFEPLKDSLAKLQLNDASLVFEPETSAALGLGFRCGFLGLLHMEIVKERLEREYGVSLIATAPNVKVRVNLKSGEAVYVENPSKMPPSGDIVSVEEPYVLTEILTQAEFLGNLLKLCAEKRGIHCGMHYLSETTVQVACELPLSEIVLDFHDRLKSTSRGYASFDYEFCGYRESKLVKMDILLNGESVDAFSAIVHQDKAYAWGRETVARLKQIIPKQLFLVAIQAAVGNKVIARETVGALRKHVTGKCYGGDITRKRKLLEKQKAGKKKMKLLGHVTVPHEAFLAVLKVGDRS